jgi:outer membrane cobalamin receptor
MNFTVAVLTSLIAIIPYVAAAQEKTTQLREVVVTATKTEKDPNDVTQPVSIISSEEIRNSGATDVPTAIQNATGVHIGNYGTPGSVQSVSIQGAFSSQILVLVDGIRMNSSRDGGFDLSMLPVSIEDIDRIEIVRGPGSALYGSDAVGGVINIITKRPTTSQNTVKGMIGSHGYDNIFLGNTGRYDQYYYALSGSRETSDGYRVNSDLDQWIYGGKMGYDISKTSYIELSANFLDNELGSPGSTTYVTPHARQRDRNAVFGGVFKMNIASSLDLKLSGYSKKDNLSLQDPDTATSNYYKTKSDGGEAQLSWLIADWNQLIAGYEIRKDSLDSSDAQAGSSSHSASLDAYYVQDEISIGEPLIIVLGVRKDDHSVYGKKSSPKASARYYLKSTGTILRASYGESFRAPTFNDLYFNTSWGVGNPNLRPESAKEYEGGIEQKIGKSGVLKFSGFDRKVKDWIQWDWSVFPMQVSNIGSVRIRGYAAEAGYDLAGALSLLLNYTYTNPVDVTTGEKLYTIPKSEAKGILTFFPEKTVYLTLQGRAVQNYVAPGESRWQYSVMDVKIAEKMWKTGEFFILVKNVFDRNYEVVKGYPMAPQEFFSGITANF